MVGGRGSGPRARALKRQVLKPGGGGTVCIGTMFWGEGCHMGVTVKGWGVTVGGLGVTVGDWEITVGVVVTVGKIGITGEAMVVTVERWFIAAVHPCHPKKK